MTDVDVCPRCKEHEYITEMKPARSVHLAPQKNKNEEGDIRHHYCRFCGYESTATFKGGEWHWETSPPMNARQQQKLDERLEELRKKRRRNQYHG